MIRKQIFSQGVKTLTMTQTSQFYITPLRYFACQNMDGEIQFQDMELQNHQLLQKDLREAYRFIEEDSDPKTLITPGQEEESFGDMDWESGIFAKGRNSRAPKRANHGARPCSSVMRKMKKKGWYHKIKDKWEDS